MPFSDGFCLFYSRKISPCRKYDLRSPWSGVTMTHSRQTHSLCCFLLLYYTREPLRTTLRSLGTGVPSQNSSSVMPEWKLAKNSPLHVHPSLSQHKQNLEQSNIIMSPFFSMQKFAFSKENYHYYFEIRKSFSVLSS